MTATSTHTRMTGNRLMILWIITAILAALTVFQIGKAILQFITEWQGGAGLLTAGILERGYSPQVFFPVEFGSGILHLMVYFALVAFLIWQRSDDWQTLNLCLLILTLGYFLTFSKVFTLTLSTQAGDDVLIGFLDLLTFATFLIFMGTFPSGEFKPGWIKYLYAAFFVLVVINDFGPRFAPAAFVGLDDLRLLFHDSIVQFTALGFMLYRLGKSEPAQRRQIQWVVYGTVLGVIGNVLDKFVITRFSETVFIFARPMVTLLFVLNSALFLFAILRYRLWDIDYVINRSLVYASLTALLGLLFLGFFYATNQLLEQLLGGANNNIAVGIAAVVVAATFTPAREWLRRFVDQRLYGIEIDYNRLIKSAPGRRVGRKPGDTKSTFGAYTGIELLGRGGMGEVYLGEHPTLRIPVAIKVLPAQFVADAEARGRFTREAQVIARLQHPNIVGILDVGEHDGIPYMVMDYIEGQDIGHMIKASGALQPEEAVGYLYDVASALDYAHSQGIVHRDIKPSNIMIRSTVSTDTRQHSATETRPHGEGRAVLMDFGIAKIASSMTALTNSTMIGTLDYMSPEQIQGAEDIDGRADIYSLGVMAYQMLTGELPFRHGNPGALLLAHLNQPAPDPRDKIPALSEEISYAILRALSKKPAERFAKAGDMVNSMV